MGPAVAPAAVGQQLVSQNWLLSHRYQIGGFLALFGIGGAATYFAIRYFKNARKQRKTGSDSSDSPSTPEALKERGNECFKKGDYAEALKYFTTAIETCSSDRAMELATFYQNRAATFEKLGELEKVLDDCSSAIALNKRYVKALLRRGKTNRALGRLEEALYDYSCAFALQEFRDMNTFRMTEQLMNECASAKAKELIKNRNQEELPLSPSFVDSYLTAYAADPVTASADPVKQRLQQEPQLASCGYCRALKCIEEKKYAEVIQACTDEITVSGEFLHLALLLRATFYILYSCVEKATADIDTLLKLLEQQPQDAQETKEMKSNAYIKRGSLHMQQIEKELALADFANAEEADPGNSDVYLHRGQLHILIGDFDRAMKDFAMAVKLRPDFALSNVQHDYARYRIAMQNNDERDAKAALKDFHQTVERFPQCSEGCMLLGQALDEQKKYEESMKYYKRALEISPDNGSIYVHMGAAILQRVQEKMGVDDEANMASNVEEALKIMKEGLKYDPYCGFAYETIGSVETQRGNTAIGMEYYEKALSYCKSAIEMQHLLTLCYDGEEAVETTGAHGNGQIQKELPAIV